MSHLKRIFWRGLVAVLPVALTIAILYWVGVSLEKVLGVAIRVFLPDHYYLPGMGLALAIIVTFATGVVVRAWLIRELLAIGESIIARIPLAKTVYGSIRDIIRYLELAADERNAGSVVAVNVGGDHTVLGFLTSESVPFAPETGTDYVAVFLPMSYQIGGYTVCVERSRVTPVDLSRDDAMRWVLTAGVSADGPGPGAHEKARRGPPL